MFWLGVLGLIGTAVFGVYDGVSKARPTTTIHVQSSGNNSPNVVDNQGNVEMQGSESDSGKKIKSPPEKK